MGVHNTTMEWTEEKVSELHRLRYVEKLKDSEIAKHFGTTRNVIAGKLSRERVKAGIEPKKRGPLGHARALPGTAQREPSLARIPASRSVVEHGPKVEFGMIEKGTGEPCILADMTGCKWPVGEVEGHPGRHIFCNAAKSSDPREPYCTTHRAIAGETHRAWTKEEDDRLRKEWNFGFGRHVLSQVLHRTKSSLAARARALGLPGGF